MVSENPLQTERASFESHSTAADHEHLRGSSTIQAILQMMNGLVAAGYTVDPDLVHAPPICRAGDERAR